VVAAGTEEPKREQAAVAASQGKSSVPGLDASSHVTGAASALVALSTLREKGVRQNSSSNVKNCVISVGSDPCSVHLFHGCSNGVSQWECMD